MWLLKTGPSSNGTANMELKQFWGDAIESYAILSHRWSDNPDDEVSFADVRHLSRSRFFYDHEQRIILAKPGFQKLVQAMHKAHTDGWQYIWIDTCCIDKDSSVALSEAINSMYRYYEQAQVCYAYLSDVDDESNLTKSVYFTRGWTLQELLAPTDLVFTDKHWNNIGTKQSLCRAVSRRTGIGEMYLLGTAPIHRATVAERMSWAANRNLSREEDVAYSLLGIFNVNMYQLYGEGKQRAFQRLQEEILKQTEDQTIFAWKKQGKEWGDVSDTRHHHGLLADGPQDFEHFGSAQNYANMPELAPPTMTARGLHCALSLKPLLQETDKTIKHFLRGLTHDQRSSVEHRIMLANLFCSTNVHAGGFLSVYLLQLQDKPNTYVRICCHRTASVAEPGIVSDIYVVQNSDYLPQGLIVPYHELLIKRVREQGRIARAISTSARILPTEQVCTQVEGVPFRLHKQPGSRSVVVTVSYPEDPGRSFDIVFGCGRETGLAWRFYVLDAADSPDYRTSVSARKTKLPFAEVVIDVEEDSVGDIRRFFVSIDTITAH